MSNPMDNAPMHTPGPWTCSGGSFGDANGIDYTIHAQGMNISKANARLIAAAPDLLAAATNLRNAQRAYMADRGNEALGKAVGDAATALDAAIAKATQ